MNPSTPNLRSARYWDAVTRAIVADRLPELVGLGDEQSIDAPETDPAAANWPRIEPGFKQHLSSATSASQQGAEARAVADESTVFEFDDRGHRPTFAADEIDFDPPGPADESDPPPCHCEDCEACRLRSSWEAVVDLTAADPWAEEVEATPYAAPCTAEDAAWECGYVVGQGMVPASVPSGLSVRDTIAWCEGNAAGWRAGLAEELARVDREEEEAAALADRYARVHDVHPDEVARARSNGGHGYGLEFGDDDMGRPAIAGGL